MGQYLPGLRENFNNGLKEFSEHPVQYTYSALKDVVKDYWDVGAMLLAGFALTDYRSEFFGDARFLVVTASGLAGLAGAGGLTKAVVDRDRLFRNLFAGFAGLFGFWTGRFDAPLSTQVTGYGLTTVMAACALVMDHARRETAPSENSQPQEPIGPLETFVEKTSV